MLRNIIRAGALLMAAWGGCTMATTAGAEFSPSYDQRYDALPEHYPITIATIYRVTTPQIGNMPAKGRSLKLNLNNKYVGVAIPESVCLGGVRRAWIFQERPIDGHVSFVYKGEGHMFWPPCPSWGTSVVAVTNEPWSWCGTLKFNAHKRKETWQPPAHVYEDYQRITGDYTPIDPPKSGAELLLEKLSAQAEAAGKTAVRASAQPRGSCAERLARLEELAKSLVSSWAKEYVDEEAAKLRRCVEEEPPT